MDLYILRDHQFSHLSPIYTKTHRVVSTDNMNCCLIVVPSVLLMTCDAFQATTIRNPLAFLPTTPSVVVGRDVRQRKRCTSSTLQLATRPTNDDELFSSMSRTHVVSSAENTQETLGKGAVSTTILAASAMIVTLMTPPAQAFVKSDQIIERVVDGDTLLTRSGTRLRMIGMNTPETVSSAQRQDGAPPECFGPEASRYTKQLLPSGAAVRLETDVEPTDQYGRSLAYVFRSTDGMFINGQLVREGFAVQKSYGRNYKYETLLREYQKEAQQARRGLWGKCSDPSATTAQRNVPPSLSSLPVTTGSSSKRPLVTVANPGDSKNCRDFADYRVAKDWYDTYFSLYGDVARLDGDGDGIPCEALPGAPKQSSSSKSHK